ncbi:hypothetical protein BJY01DRAFT_255877 [Aspergillus pseudoustus]|uniref:Uncharacterized protein n=1 Tax=Aspergillus pseudoustus TaxID=1810923 RepID=A0ABR4IGM7_9EURO
MSKSVAQQPFPQSTADPPGFDLYIACSKQYSELLTTQSVPGPISHPPHWVLVQTPRDRIHQYCTFYHVAGGPYNYEYLIEQGQSLHGPRIDCFAKVATVSGFKRRVVLEIALCIEPMRCQEYICRILEELEVIQAIPKLVIDHYRMELDKSVLAQVVEGRWVLPDTVDRYVNILVQRCEAFAKSQGLDNMVYDTCLR